MPSGWARRMRALPPVHRDELDDDGMATVVTTRTCGSPGRFLGSATLLICRQVRRSIGADLDRLRACLMQGSGERR